MQSLEMNSSMKNAAQIKTGSEFFRIGPGLVLIGPGPKSRIEIGN